MRGDREEWSVAAAPSRAYLPAMTYETNLQLFIDGVWKSGEGRDAHPVVNPVDAQPIAEVPYATKADLDEALAASERAWPEWRALDVEKRGAILHKAAALLRERADLIGRTMTQEQGKPFAEAKGEVIASAQLFDWYAEDAKRDYGRTLVRPAGQISRVIRQPVGPDGDLHAVEFPDLPAGEEGQRRARRRLHGHLAPAARDPRLLHRAVPRARRRRHPQRCRPAHPRRRQPGQRSPHRQPSHPQGQLHRLDQCRQAPHAPLRRQHDARDDGARRPRAGADLRRLRPREDARHGRPAEIPQRRPGVRLADPLLRAEAAIYDAFLKGFAERTAKVKVGSGLDADTRMGPLANKRRPEAVGALVDDAKAKGARVLAGGEKGDGGFFFQPTLLADVPNEAQIMNDEPFGPVAVTRPFDTFEEAIEQANRLPFGLAAFAFTENGRRANLIGDLVESGMVGINTFAISGADTPFGGVKDSGFGSEGGKEGLESYQVVKAIHQA